MGAFDISYNDIAGAPLGSGKKKVAPIQAAQGIAAPTTALSSPQLIDARQSITQAPTVQQLVPAQSITQGAETNIKVSEILALTDHKPLFGHPSGKRGGTHWICFMKAEAAGGGQHG